MNRPIRKLAVACLLMFVALLVNANVVQVVEAQSLRNNPNNSRLLANRLNNDRGPIVVGNQAVAASVPTPDQTYKYQRGYPFGTLYPNVTGYFTVYTETGIEQSEDDVLSGTDDRLFLRRLADTLTGRQVRGGRVVLTLNQAAQQAAASGLAASGHPGAVVALDPRTRRRPGDGHQPQLRPEPADQPQRPDGPSGLRRPRHRPGSAAAQPGGAADLPARLHLQGGGDRHRADVREIHAGVGHPGTADLQLARHQHRHPQRRGRDLRQRDVRHPDRRADDLLQHRVRRARGRRSVRKPCRSRRRHSA